MIAWPRNPHGAHRAHRHKPRRAHSRRAELSLMWSVDPQTRAGWLEPRRLRRGRRRRDRRPKSSRCRSRRRTATGCGERPLGGHDQQRPTRGLKSSTTASAASKIGARVNSQYKYQQSKSIIAEHRCCERRKRHTLALWLRLASGFNGSFIHSPAPSNGFATFRDGLFDSRPKAARNLRHRNSYQSSLALPVPPSRCALHSPVLERRGARRLIKRVWNAMTHQSLPWPRLT